MNNRLVIHENLNNRQILYLLLTLVSILFFLYKISFWRNAVLKVVGISFLTLCFALILMSLFYSIWHLKNKIVAVIDKEGIWVRYHGLILWANIEDIFIYSIATTPIETVAINFHDPSIIAQQSSISGKIRLFWSKLFKYPHVVLANIDTENEVIISFTRRFKY